MTMVMTHFIPYYLSKQLNRMLVCFQKLLFYPANIILNPCSTYFSITSSG